MKSLKVADTGVASTSKNIRGLGNKEMLEPKKFHIKSKDLITKVNCYVPPSWHVNLRK